ncbi:hypothetical protein HPHPA16_1276 [Helicobacter pylori Hp A-16]|nr:hypothetical protein HPHPA16_1276 [Helicobacter pylori Hp A-16]
MDGKTMKIIKENSELEKAFKKDLSFSQSNPIPLIKKKLQKKKKKNWKARKKNQKKH